VGPFRWGRITSSAMRRAVSRLGPWVSWADTHKNYSTVNQIAGFIWKSDPKSSPASSCTAGRLSYAHSSSSRYSALRMRRANIIVACTRCSPVVSVTRLSISKDHLMCAYFYPFCLCPSSPGSSGAPSLSRILQYIVSPSCEEQGRHHRLRSHDGRADRKAEIEHLIRRRTFDYTIYFPHRFDTLRQASKTRPEHIHTSHCVPSCAKSAPIGSATSSIIRP
jgi:hypothetical protein